MRVLLFLLFSVLLSAQTTPYSYSLNKISGMPSDMVYDVFQDKKGFMWFATAKGICRYDGLQIKNYFSTDFPVGAVSNIQEDSDGRIWFQDFNGSIFFIENNTINQFKSYKANGFMKYGLMENKLFIVGKQGIKIFDLTSLRLLKTIHINLKTKLQSIVAKNKFYIVGDDVHYLNNQGKLMQVDLPADFKDKILAPIPIAKENGLYIFSKFNENYLEIDNQGIRYKKFPFNTIFTQNVSVIGDELWACSTKGIYQYNLTTGQHHQYFPNINISFINKSKSGNYWISTFTHGVLFADDLSSNFIETPSTPMRLAKNKDELFFSTNREEIFKMDSHYDIQKIYKGSSDHMIAPLFIDKLNDRLLFASSKFTIKTPTAIFQNILAAKHIVQIDAKYYAVSASTWNGVVTINPNMKSDWDKAFEQYKKTTVDGIQFITLIASENGKDCTIDRAENSIYFLTNYGLRRFHKAELENISSEAYPPFIQLGIINKLLYILSENEKLYQFKNNSFEEVKLPNSFENEAIYRMKILGDNIYIFKGKTIFLFQPKKSTLTKVIDIPKELEINDIAEQETHLFFATNKGIIKMENDNYSAFHPAQLFINSILVNGKQTGIEKLNNLKASDNNIEIDFDILTESPNTNYSIEYRIDENPWETITNTTRNLKFSSLSYGNHVIQLKITNGNQIITKNINLIIASPFWLKWWFLVLAILGTLAIAYLYFRRKLKLVNERNKKELEKINLEKLANQSKLKSLKSQMNPHFFFNALNTLQSYIVTNEKREAVTYLSKFSKLTRSILEMSDRESVSVQEEVQTLITYLELEKTRFNGDFSFDINADDSLQTPETTIPSLLLQPYVENAVKHGLLHKKGKKTLVISFRDVNNNIIITIDDDGIGRKMSAELNSIKNKDHKSFATQSLEERVQLLNANKTEKISIEYIDKEQSKGTTVLITIPKNTTD